MRNDRSALIVWAGVAAVVAAMLARIVARNGEIVFPLDDPFLHLAIAKHLVENGVYGVTRESFSAASSSIAWPWVLAAIEKVAGDHRITPILLNLAAAAALLVHVGRRAPAWTLVAIALVAPLAPMIVLGMEHVAHAWITVLLLSAGLETREGRGAAAKIARLALLGLVAALATSLRYESLALVAILAAVLLARRQYPAALAVVAGGLVPPALFAVYAHAHGGPPVPTSVLLKAHAGGALGTFVANVREAPHLIAWLVALLAVAAWLRTSTAAAAEERTLLLAVAALIAAHLVFGRVGWFYRYEMYLVVAAAYALGRAALHLPPLPRPAVQRGVMVLAVLALALLPLERAVAAHLATVPAAGNIHDQQLHTARFLQRYFPGEKVAVNDAGAVGYLHDGPMVDLLGLADLDVARARGFAIDHALSREQVRDLSAGAKVAIVYDEWFEGAIPAEWTRVATWTIEGNRVCAFPTVAVYATSAASLLRVQSAVDAPP